MELFGRSPRFSAEKHTLNATADINMNPFHILFLFVASF